MSFLTDLGHTLGKILKVAAPVAAFIPGIGPVVAAAGEGLGTLMAPGGNIGKAAMGAGETALGGELGGAAGPGSSTLSSLLGKVPGVSSLLNSGGGVLNSVVGKGGVKGALSSVAQWAVKHPEDVMGAISMISGANTQSKANAQLNNYLNEANANAKALAPVRSALIQNLTNQAGNMGTTPTAGPPPSVPQVPTFHPVQMPSYP